MVTTADVRDLALELPETSERPSYGTPGFRVKNRLFARLHQDGESLVLKMDLAQREATAAAEPEKFSWTPQYEKYAWILVRLAAIDREELRELLTLAWLQTAPPHEAAAFEATGGDQPLALNPPLRARRGGRTP